MVSIQNIDNWGTLENELKDRIAWAIFDDGDDFDDNGILYKHELYDGVNSEYR